MQKHEIRIVGHALYTVRQEMWKRYCEPYYEHSGTRYEHEAMINRTIDTLITRLGNDLAVGDAKFDRAEWFRACGVKDPSDV